MLASLVNAIFIIVYECDLICIFYSIFSVLCCCSTHLNFEFMQNKFHLLSSTPNINVSFGGLHRSIIVPKIFIFTCLKLILKSTSVAKTIKSRHYRTPESESIWLLFDKNDHFHRWNATNQWTTLIVFAQILESPSCHHCHHHGLRLNPHQVNQLRDVRNSMALYKWQRILCILTLAHTNKNRL